MHKSSQNDVETENPHKNENVSSKKNHLFHVNYGKIQQRVNENDAALNTNLLLESYEKPERTFGLRAFDTILYPGIANTGVFALSVGLTFLTQRGAKIGKTYEQEGSRFFGLMRSKDSHAKLIGKGLNWRGDKLKEGLIKLGLPEQTAGDFKIVIWSFLDGSTLAPVIKSFEDNRENIAKYIDTVAGTQPEDDTPYNAEPKQTWGSVIGARALTAGIVVPTALILDRKKFGAMGQRVTANEKLLYAPGRDLAIFVNKKTGLGKKIGMENLSALGEYTVFEGFYTSVCTAGQYFFSRTIASLLNEPLKKQPDSAAAPSTTIEPATDIQRLHSADHVMQPSV